MELTSRVVKLSRIGGLMALLVVGDALAPAYEVLEQGLFNPTPIYAGQTAHSEKSVQELEDILAQRIHELVNKERVERRLRPLRWNDKLASIAKRHSIDMATRDYFDHDSPDGQQLSDRYKQARFNCEIREDRYIYGGAENISHNRIKFDDASKLYQQSVLDLYNRIALSYAQQSGSDMLEDVTHFTVSGWMKSQGHRENILKPFWLTQGIGVSITSKEGLLIYVTQNFC